MSNWDVDNNGMVEIAPIVSFETCIANGYSGGPFLILRLESLDGNNLEVAGTFKQFLLSPQQAAKIAEALAIAAKTIISSNTTRSIISNNEGALI